MWMVTFTVPSSEFWFIGPISSLIVTHRWQHPPTLNIIGRICFF
jgi:hypothetical protein